MKAFGNFVVETNNGDGWNIESDPDTNAALLTRKRAREVKKAYENVLANADKPYRVRVVSAGYVVPHHNDIYGEPRVKGVS